MIDLTRLNGTRFTLNCDLIKYVEAAPDTTLTLAGGEKLIVRERLDEIKWSIRAYRGSVLRAACPNPASCASAAYESSPASLYGLG